MLCYGLCKGVNKTLVSKIRTIGVNRTYWYHLNLKNAQIQSKLTFVLGVCFNRVGRFLKIEFGISITYVGRSPEKNLFTDNFFVAIKASRLEREWASVEASQKLFACAQVNVL